MINDALKATGEVRFVLVDENGNLKQDITHKNLVVTVGKAFIASRMTGTSKAVMSHMWLGSGSTAADASQTALTTYITNASASVTATASSNTVTYVATFGANVPVSSGSTQISEAGLFNGTGGTTPTPDMLARTTFTQITKLSGDTLTITWTITIA